MMCLSFYNGNTNNEVVLKISLATIHFSYYIVIRCKYNTTAFRYFFLTQIERKEINGDLNHNQTNRLVISAFQN